MIKTSHLMTWTKLRFLKPRGFTLIELLVVLGIMILIVLTILPSVNSYFQLSINSTARDLANTIKETYYSAMITGKVHRLVYDIKEGKFWVESTSSSVLLSSITSQEKEKLRSKGKAKEKKTSPFSIEKTITRKKISLATGVSFEDILTQQKPEAITQGTAYTHFFPHGISERTLIHLKDSSEHHASLVIQPLLGNTDLYDRYVTEKEILDFLK